MILKLVTFTIGKTASGLRQKASISEGASSSLQQVQSSVKKRKRGRARARAVLVSSRRTQSWLPQARQERRLR